MNSTRQGKHKMTGIFLYKAKKGKRVPRNVEEQADLLQHRGRYSRKKIVDDSTFLKVFYNKAQRENDSHGIQPGHFKNGSPHVIIDGAIFNKDSVRQQMGERYEMEPFAAETIWCAYQRWQDDAFGKLQGMFSMVMVDGDDVIACRDPVGFNPLYMIENDDAVIIASELKALKHLHGNPVILPPGSVFKHDGKHSTIKRYFHAERLQGTMERGKNDANEFKTRLFRLLRDAVKRTIDTDCKTCALLSGGIDSTIICALATIFVPEMDAYTVAYEGSEDLEFAKLFADQHKHDINHHVFMIDLESMIKIIPKVIYALETFDAALIRSAIPMYHALSNVKPGTDIILTGEGGDELFGGYSYLKELDDAAFKEELVNLLKVEHATGLQRVDRVPYAFGIEARAPWFDMDIVKLAFEVPAGMKIRNVEGRKVEKWIVREAFKHVIPPRIASRPKAKFSKGVGSQFIMRDYLNERISDDEFETEREIFPGVLAKSKEELYYWRIFQDEFGVPETFVRTLPRTKFFIT